jgi:serine/threonine protein kinase
VFEYYSEGDFEKYISTRIKNNESFTEKEILRFLANMALSIAFLNSNKIYHRDIKPGNFLIKRFNGDKMYLMMNDFGLARNMNATVT